MYSNPDFRTVTSISQMHYLNSNFYTHCFHVIGMPFWRVLVHRLYTFCSGYVLKVVHISTAPPPPRLSSLSG